MRIRVGHHPNDWIDHGPSIAISSEGYRGGPIESHVNQSEAQRSAARRHREKVSSLRGSELAPICNDPLTSRCRHAHCVDMRQEEAQRLAMDPSLTLAEIGRRLGGRNHSTVKWMLSHREAMA